jgi:hypothetical protein
MKIELVEKYSVLAWRKKVGRGKGSGMALGLVRSYIDDILVFDRLTKMGFKIDGEIIKSPFFDDICVNVTKFLKQGNARANDGMGHLDKIADGRYGPLRRSTFLIQAEYIKSKWYKQLSDNHKQLLDEFIAAFRKHRSQEAAKADRVLALFRKHDIHSVKGHALILKKWAQIEGLNKWVGISIYKREGNGFILPYPLEKKTTKTKNKDLGL